MKSWGYLRQLVVTVYTGAFDPWEQRGETLGLAADENTTYFSAFTIDATTLHSLENVGRFAIPWRDVAWHAASLIADLLSCQFGLEGILGMFLCSSREGSTMTASELLKPFMLKEKEKKNFLVKFTSFPCLISKEKNAGPPFRRLACYVSLITPLPCRSLIICLRLNVSAYEAPD